MTILDGKSLAKDTLQYVRDKIAHIPKAPCLGIVQTGDDEASHVYVEYKERDCEKCGIHTLIHNFGTWATTSDVISKIQEWNESPMVDGIIVQLPIMSGLDAFGILEAIAPEKDVDCLTSKNVGLLALRRKNYVPCTPAGIIRLLIRYNVPMQGARCIIVGRSAIVGRPLAMLMEQQDATVTLCHSYTKYLPEITRQADILVSATGTPNLITANMVKPGAVVIDVGITRGADGKLHGDVDFPNVAKIAGWVTPVPGGVGPMTRAMLMRNVLHATMKNMRRN